VLSGLGPIFPIIVRPSHHLMTPVFTCKDSGFLSRPRRRWTSTLNRRCPAAAEAFNANKFWWHNSVAFEHGNSFVRPRRTSRYLAELFGVRSSVHLYLSNVTINRTHERALKPVQSLQQYRFTRRYPRSKTVLRTVANGVTTKFCGGWWKSVEILCLKINARSLI
jgi:hypothetical protein